MLRGVIVSGSQFCAVGRALCILEEVANGSAKVAAASSAVELASEAIVAEVEVEALGIELTSMLFEFVDERAPIPHGIRSPLG